MVCNVNVKFKSNEQAEMNSCVQEKPMTKLKSILKLLTFLHVMKIRIVFSYQTLVFSAQLICVFIFAFAKSWFSHDMAHL